MSTSLANPLLVIASYPPRGEKHSKAIVGGAMYAKNTLEATKAVAKKRDLNLKKIILAEKIAHPPRHSERSEESSPSWWSGP